MAALVALAAGVAPAVSAQQRLHPLPAPVAQLAKPNPRPASPPPAADPQTAAPTTPANGCSLSIDQMQQVAWGQVLRLGQGDCQMRFNTIR